MKLIKWLTYASQEVVKSENKVETFLRLRYDEMNRLFPHDPFGIDRASMSFFDDAISDLTIPGNLKKRIDSTDLYELRYQRWIEQNQS